MVVSRYDEPYLDSLSHARYRLSLKEREKKWNLGIASCNVETRRDPSKDQAEKEVTCVTYHPTSFRESKTDVIFGIAVAMIVLSTEC